MPAHARAVPELAVAQGETNQIVKSRRCYRLVVDAGIDSRQLVELARPAENAPGGPAEFLGDLRVEWSFDPWCSPWATATPSHQLSTSDSVTHSPSFHSRPGRRGCSRSRGPECEHPCSPTPRWPGTDLGAHEGGVIGRPLIAIADVAAVVSSAKASAKWWMKNLGFSSYTVGGEGHAILVVPTGDRFLLHLCEGFAPLEPGDTGIAFVTDEMDAPVARMIDAGVKFPEPPKKEEGGIMAKFADPDGNIFWLLGAPTPLVRVTLSFRAPSRRRTSAEPRVRPRKR